MKKILISFLLVLIFISCSKEQPKPNLTYQIIADGVSQSICQKAITCSNSDASTKTECVRQTNQALLKLLETKKIELTQNEFDVCVASIEKNKCEDVMRANDPPKGCEKLK